MAAVDPYSIDGAIHNAQIKKKNVYLLSQMIDSNGVMKLSNSIRKIPGRIRFCFKNANILEESIIPFEKLFSEDLDFDAFIFLNCQIHNFPKFCQAIGHCSSLSILSFTSCHFDDAHIEALISQLVNFKHLQTFDISKESIGPVMFVNVCHALCANRELRSFGWSDTQLGDPGAFVDLVKSIPSLTHIDFSHAILSETWVKALSELLDGNWQLKELKITDTNPSLREKLERNQNRNELLKKGPSSRMIRYAIADNDELFDEF